MGAYLSFNNSEKLFVIKHEKHGPALLGEGGRTGHSLVVAGFSWLKLMVFPTFAALAMQVSAMEDAAVAGGKNGFLGDESVIIAKKVGGDEERKIVDFVLCEVRRELDPNPETEIVELMIDPDYRGANETYLVNVVLDAHGRRLSVGVVVAVKRTSNGLQAKLEYLD